MAVQTTRGAASAELAQRVGGEEEGWNPDRVTGVELARKRSKERRTGGVFVQNDIPLHVLDIIEKGEYPRSTPDERFVPQGRAEEIAKEFAELEGLSEEVTAQFEAANAAAAALARKDQEEEDARIAAEEEARRAMEEARRAAEEEKQDIARRQREDWEAAMLAKEGAFDREPTEADLALVAEMAAQLGPQYDIPEELLGKCRFSEDVNELVELKKQFRDIDVDDSGAIDTHELLQALKKMGMDPTEEQVRGLMSATDDTEDGEVDFVEFVDLIHRFQSSRKERAHQQADRKGMRGLEDAVKNINLEEMEFVETEFGSRKAVVKKKAAHEWEQFMEYEDPLHWAAGKGDLAALQQFVMAIHDAPEIRPDRINKDAKMPMHYAATWNQVHILRYLLDKPPTGSGVGIDPQDFNYVTPLMMASEAGRLQAVDFLIESWANIQQRNRGGVTPLMLACKFGHVEVAESLIRSGFVVSGSDDESVRLWSLRKAGLSRTLERNKLVKGPVFCIGVWMDQVATGHQDGMVRLSAITTQQVPPYAQAGFEKGPRIFEGHKGAVLCLKMERSATTTQARHMATGSEDASVRIWNIETAKCIQVLKDKRPGQLPSPVMSVDLSPPTDRVVSGTRHGLFFMWQMSTGEMLQHYTPHQGMTVNVLQLDGDTVMSGSNDRSVRILDVANNRFRLYQGHESLVNCAVRIDARPGRGGRASGEPFLPETIVSGSNIGEIFTFTVDRRPSNDAVDRRGHFSGGRSKGLAFSSPVNDLKVVEYGGVQLVIACSTTEGGVRVWNLANDDGSQPLHTFLGHADDIRCLAWYGVGINVTDSSGISPLMTAAELGMEDVVKLLLDCVCVDVWIGDRNTCETALHRAARYGHIGCMRLLLEHDPDLVHAGTADHSGVLHLAVLDEMRGAECASLALEYGANVNQLNNEGRTAAHVAAGFGRYKALRVLVRVPGVNLNRLDAEYPIGGLPLVRPKQAPAEHRYPNLVSAPTQLVATGKQWTDAQPRHHAGAARIKKDVVTKYKLIRHQYGWSPLHEAAAFGHTAAVKILAEANADVNIRDEMARTPLHLACANGTPDLIAVLASNGALCNRRDCHGAVPLMYAVKNAQETAVVKMLELYPDIRLDLVEDIYGLSALHMAAKYGLEEVTFLLLEAGAEQNEADLRMCTPLHYAVSGAVIGLVDNTPPELPHDIREAAFGMHGKRAAATWVKMWDEGEIVRRGLSDRRLQELREEVREKFGRFVETSQVLLDGFSKYETTDVSGKTAIDYAKSHPEAWKEFETMFANSTPDGNAFLVVGDIIKARYLGDTGTKYEHPNLWEMVSRYGVRCKEGSPSMFGSRAFKRFESRFAQQEVDWRALGELKVGEAGELERAGSTLYELSFFFHNDATGFRTKAHSFLCNWKGAARTFETKMSALHVGIEAGSVYELRVEFVEDWGKGVPAKYTRGVAKQGEERPGTSLSEMARRE